MILHRLQLMQTRLSIFPRQVMSRALLGTQVPRQVTTIKLGQGEAIAQEGKDVPVKVVNLVVLKARRTDQLEEGDPGPGEHGHPAALALLEPAGARARPGGAREEEVGVLDVLLADVEARREGLDVLALHLGDDGDHVLGHHLERGHEGAVAEGRVRRRGGPVVGDWELIRPC